MSSTGRGGPLGSMLLGFVEYLFIVYWIEAANEGSRVVIAGRGERPEVDVRNRVFMGLRKQPSGVPMELN